jgi:hypothetical protein
MDSEREKTAMNARAKAAMQQYLKSRTWPEKIRSIERMNEAGRIARESMKKARGQNAICSGGKKARHNKDSVRTSVDSA